MFSKEILIALFIPFIGTTLGSAMVFVLNKNIKPSVEKALLGFAAGVMLSASMWSLLLPAVEMAEESNQIRWLPAATGFILGMLFLLILDSIIPHLHSHAETAEGLQNSKFKKITMLIIAVVLHNIPEGMAAGVVIAGAMLNNKMVSMSGALVLVIGLAIQNAPEGAIISMPLKAEKNVGKFKSFLYGALSGIVEPIVGLITILFLNIFLPMLPYLLAFAAGAMIYVVVEELAPDLQHGRHSNVGMIGVTAGFALMMILDIAFG